MFQDASSLGSLIMIITTCVMVVYLLFQMTNFIGKLIQQKQDDSIVIEKKDQIHITINKQMTVEVEFQKIKRLFWWTILIGYGIGFLLAYAVVVVIPAVILLILAVRRVFKMGLFKGVTRVLKIASPK
jgi:4-amino-4-deoxy-L-arabinose transferase-like glycosyltransferase